MIDLTPLDVRNKRGDFKRLMRGYDPQEVDVFLELTADRLEVLVRENLQLKERVQSLEEQVNAQAGREQAVQDALVTAQELRADIRAQSQREAEHMLRESEAKGRRLIVDAEAEARRVIRDAEGESIQRVRELESRIEQATTSIQELERRRVRFLKEFRGLLARELNVVEVEEDKLPFEERAIDLDLGAARGGSRTRRDPVAEEPIEVPDAQPSESLRDTRDARDVVDDDAAYASDAAYAADASDAAHGSEPVDAEEDATVVPDPDMDVHAAAEVADSGELATDIAPVTESADDAVDPGARPAVPPVGPPPLPPTHAVGAAGFVPPQPVLDVPTRDRGGHDAIDVADLRPEGSADLEAAGDPYEEVPDFETLLAEAGIAGTDSGQNRVDAEDDRRPDSFILFDSEEKGPRD